jgi:hypothetical protein
MGVHDVSHCFHLNGFENPCVIGVQGILDSYRNAITGGIGLYGPTNFSPCLRAMMAYIRSRLELQEYSIMLYLTDGAITDLELTIETIVEASSLPLSMFINNQFSLKTKFNLFKTSYLIIR